MTYRSRTRRVHDMPNGGTCVFGPTCTYWDHLTYVGSCDCGWKLEGKTKASVDYARKLHKHLEAS